MIKLSLKVASLSCLFGTTDLSASKKLIENKLHPSLIIKEAGV